MKAGVLYAKGDIRYEEIETPVPKAGEVLIRVRMTGICGSDIPRVLMGTSHFFPNVLGHEFAGEVAGWGEGVEGFKKGEPVTAAPLIPCRSCEDCSKGNYSLCKHYKFTGSSLFGSFAEYVAVPAGNVVRLPEGCGFREGAMIEPVTVGLHGLMNMDFKPLMNTAVVGTGTIGMLTLQCAKAMGAGHVTAFDVSPTRLEIAKAYGADTVICTGCEDYAEQAERLTAGALYHNVLETAGYPAAEIAALRLACNKGSVMFIGTPHTELTLKPKEFEYMNRKELTVRGSWMSYSAPFPGKEWTLAAELFAAGKIKTEKLVDRIIPLSQIADAFKALGTKGEVNGKILLEV